MNPETSEKFSLENEETHSEGMETQGEDENNEVISRRQSLRKIGGGIAAIFGGGIIANAGELTDQEKYEKDLKSKRHLFYYNEFRKIQAEYLEVTDKTDKRKKLHELGEKMSDEGIAPVQLEIGSPQERRVRTYRDGLISRFMAEDPKDRRRQLDKFWKEYFPKSGLTAKDLTETIDEDYLRLYPLKVQLENMFWFSEFKDGDKVSFQCVMFSEEGVDHLLKHPEEASDFLDGYYDFRSSGDMFQKNKNPRAVDAFQLKNMSIGFSFQHLKVKEPYNNFEIDSEKDKPLFEYLKEKSVAEYKEFKRLAGRKD